MKLLRNLKDQKGFTLVELAIVLVIIGIMLGAVLKGQELINNAKIKRVYNQQREIAAAVYSYYDKYGYYPGDDRNAAARFAAPNVLSGDGDGSIALAAANTAPNFGCNASGTEQCDLWSELRQSNLIGGASGTTTFSNPQNAFGGAIAVTYYSVQGLATNWVALQNVPFDVCQTLDRQYDDGIWNTGTVRATTNYNTATTGVFNLYFKL
jgi:prepilin-type N-terminal cleavage/methylation domain-containing protein